MTQCPHETQLDSPIGAPPSHNTRGCAILPIDAQRFIDLEGLARLNAASAENALVGIVAIEGIGHIHFIGLGLVGDFLMLDCEQLGGVMHGAVAVVVVADRAVEQMIAEDAVKGFALRRIRTRRRGDHVHALGGHGAAGSHQFAVDLHHAGIAGLDRSKLGVIANVRYFDSAAVDQVDQALSRLNCLWLAVNGGCHMAVHPPRLILDGSSWGKDCVKLLDCDTLR